MPFYTTPVIVPARGRLLTLGACRVSRPLRRFCAVLRCMVLRCDALLCGSWAKFVLFTRTLRRDIANQGLMSLPPRPQSHLIHRDDFQMK